jgi:hypothetical protein
MPISVDRIRSDIDAIARFTESPGGADRPTFSPAWRQARDYVIEQDETRWLQGADRRGGQHARAS